MRRDFAFFAFAVAILSLAFSAGRTAGAQQPVPMTIPPGYVLVDDMFLPWDAVYGDATYNGTLWTSGTVPYTFDASASASNQTAAINAMAEWEAVADVDFVPRTAEANYIRWVSSTGNSSNVGMIGGLQNVNIVSWGTKYVLCHELCHALSAKHEQSRPDRDTFVTINWANISQTACSGGPCDSNFQIDAAATTVGAYDFLSIMHYSGTAFSANGSNTITCKAGYTSFQNQIGNRTYMTFSDALGMQNRYGAPAAPVVSSLSQTWAVVGSAAFTLTVNGTRFFQGSPNASGVQGSRVRWNGSDLPTTYVSPTQLTATVSASLLTGTGCIDITVNNAYPGGGASNAIDFTVGPNGAFANTWVGTSEYSHLGWAVAALGDVNGDGKDDVLVGEPDYDAGKGRAWCFSGADGAPLWSLTGGTAYSLGKAVAAAGDVNGDGKTDALIGAPGYSSDAGLMRVINGATGAIIRTHLGSTYGAVAGDQFGFAVSNAGDENGDGTPDHVVGSPGYSSSTGRARVVSGTAVSAIYTVTGAATGDQFGYAVAGGWSVNSDAVSDFVVGAPFYDGAGTDRGRITICSGSTGSSLTTKTGDGDYDRFGMSVAMGPSIDGRTGGCVIAGADEFGSNPFGSLAEEGYVRVFGFTGPASWPTLATYNGSAAGDTFGHAVGWAGDTDQDGYPDVLVGAPQNTALVSEPGYVRILSGRTGATIHNDSGANADDTFGWAVAAGFNEDGDSIADILVGAPFYDNSTCTSIGNARVLEPVFPPSVRKVMITEVAWGEPEGLEITNSDTVSVTLSGWTVEWDDGTTKTSTALNLTLIPGEAAVITDGGGAFPETPAGIQVLPVLPAISMTTQDVTVALFNNNGQVVDEVRVSDTAGAHAEGSLGGLFRGLAVRGTLSSAAGTSGSVERIWGLDSNSGGDWTDEPQSGMGLESRSSGTRGTDPIAAAVVVINELDDSPDLIEFKVVSGGLFGLITVEDWWLLCSAGQGSAHSIIRPWPESSVVGGYFVIGEGAAPAELPVGIPYVNVTSLGINLPWITEELDCAFYDNYGRLIDLVRTTGHDDEVVHNHSRAPAIWSAFGGAAGRNNNGGDQAVGRDDVSTDTDTGADFRPVFTRTMGSSNTAATMAGPAGHGDLFDVRLNDGVAGGGLSFIINAGSAYAGYKYSLIPSLGHSSGLGPFWGLGADALVNFLSLYDLPPWTGLLDARGSARFDLAPNSLPAGVDTDNIFILQAPSGLLTHRTKVLEFDT